MAFSSLRGHAPAMDRLPSFPPGDPRMSGPLLDAVAVIARQDPARPAYIDHGRAVTYADLAGRIGGMAAWLARQGLPPGAMVGLTLREDLPHLVASLALMHLGCDQISLASHDPPTLRAALAGRLGVALVIGDGEEDALPGRPFLRIDPAGPGPGEAPPARGVPGAARLVLSSSGTTGRPKLVPLTQSDIARQMARRAHESLMSRVYYRSTTVEHNNARKYHLGLLSRGATVVLSNCATLPDLAEACERFDIGRVTLPPERAAALADLQSRAGARRWPAQATLAVFGAMVPPALRRRLMTEVTPRLTVNYSTTEAGTITLAGPDDHASHPDGIGRPLPRVELHIVDDDGNTLPAGETGLVRLRAHGMARGYLDDPEADARAFHDGWFQPGDRGRLDPDGTLIFVGRDAEMMMLGTINIFPAEIERAAEGFPGLAECAAFAVRSPTLGDIPALAVVEAVPGALDTAALMARCRARLGLRAPRRVVVVPALPRNASGKVQRDRLGVGAAPGAAQ